MPPPAIPANKWSPIRSGSGHSPIPSGWSWWTISTTLESLPPRNALRPSVHQWPAAPYHLRTFAKHGYTEQVRQPGREKPWKVVSRSRSQGIDPDAPGSVYAVAATACLEADRQLQRTSLGSGGHRNFRRRMSTETPPGMQGRTSAATQVIMNVPQVAASVIAAALIGVVDYRAMIGAMGALCVLAVLPLVLGGRRSTAATPGNRTAPSEEHAPNG